MQNHRVAFTRAFITSAFAAPDDGDLVSLVWLSPDAVAVLSNHYLVHREFIPAMYILYMYRKGTCFANIGLWEVCSGLYSPTASRQQDKLSYVIFLMPLLCYVTRGRIIMGGQTCIPGTKPQKSKSAQSIITLPS